MELSHTKDIGKSSVVELVELLSLWFLCPSQNSTQALPWRSRGAPVALPSRECARTQSVRARQGVVGARRRCASLLQNIPFLEGLNERVFVVTFQV